MDFEPRENTLAAVYRTLDAGSRRDQATRLAAWALDWSQALEESVDIDQVKTLSLLVPVAAKIRREFKLKTAVEACLVEQGWPPARTRDLLRSLERLPAHPKTPEEKLIADADSVTQLGALGLLRHTAAAAHKSLDEALASAERATRCRLFTKPAQKAAAPLRKQLSDLIHVIRAQLKS